MLPRFPKLYAITDQQLSGLSHAQQVTLLSEGGATLIQLRDKQSSPREFQREAALAIQVARQLGVRIIINDRVDIALALEADGVHLGQTDMPVPAARKLLGAKAWIGLSTHNIEQATCAAGLPVDYIAFGPIFPTGSKDDSEPVVGLTGLRAVRQQVGKTPLVAIGGITPANVATVFRAGADSVALIGALISNPKQIHERVRALVAVLE